MSTVTQITLAFSGASGAPYGWRLLELLLAHGIKVHLLISSAARVVFATEHNIKLPAAPEKCTEYLQQHFGCDKALLKVYGKDDWFSPVASGSAAPRQMVVCPCSTGTVSAIATGASDRDSQIQSVTTPHSPAPAPHRVEPSAPKSKQTDS